MYGRNIFDDRSGFLDTVFRNDYLLCRSRCGNRVL